MSLRGTPQLCVVSVSSCLACSASLPASPSSVELDTTPGSERKRREERGRERGREGGMKGWRMGKRGVKEEERRCVIQLVKKLHC